MEPLDGNAIAGQLFDTFGVEMTTASGTCASCGATAQIGELMVYMRAPGAVARCPACGVVLIVVTEQRGATNAHFSGFALHDPPAGGY